jgi:hypothetical protein
MNNLSVMLWKCCSGATRPHSGADAILDFGQRRIVRDLADQTDSEVKQVLPFLLAQPGETRNVVLRRIGVTVAEKLTYIWIAALRAGFDTGRICLRQRFPLRAQQSWNILAEISGQHRDALQNESLCEFFAQTPQA